MLSVPNLKYKTTYCNNWRNGQFCNKGLNCFFAHGEQDLRTIEDNRAFIANRNKYSLESESVENYKTIFCKFFTKGQCKLGQACTFAHQRSEKRAKKISEPQQNLDYYSYIPYFGQNYSLQSFQPYFYQNFPMQFNFENVEGDVQVENLKISVETMSDEREGSENQAQNNDVMPNIEDGQEIIIQEKFNKNSGEQDQKQQ